MYLSFCCLCFCVISKKAFPVPTPPIFTSVFSSKSFCFSSYIQIFDHFELIFAYSVRCRSSYLLVCCNTYTVCMTQPYHFQVFTQVHSKSMYISTLFITAKTWKQLRCPLTVPSLPPSVVHPYNGIQLCNKKERSTDMPNNMDKSQMSHAY